MSVTVKTAKSRAELKAFITFPEKLYADEPRYIPSLRSDEWNTLLPEKNDAYSFCEAEFFLAYKDGRLAGRVAAIINRNANRDWNSANVRFGWIDFIEDFEVAKALIGAVEDWGRSKGMTRCNGPLGFTDMDKEGMLVEGFENEGTFTTIWNFPYYPEYLERLGYSKEVDWVQEIMDIPPQPPQLFEQYCPLIEERFHVHTIKPRRKSDITDHARGVFECWNEAFKPLYEFTQISDRQIDDYVRQYVPFLNKDLVSVILDDESGRVVGFCICMPSMSRGYRAANGRILRGIFQLIDCLIHVRKVEMLMIGVLPEYQSKGVVALMFEQLNRNFNRMGITSAITNPKLEENTKVQTMFNYYETRPYQRRRCYGKELR